MSDKFLLSLGLVALLTSSLQAHAGPIKVALWEDSFGCCSSSVTVNANPVKAFLEDDDNHEFDVTYVTKAQVESGVLNTSSFDTFLTGGRQYVRWSDSMALATRNYVTSGGGFVGIGWGITYSTSSLSSTGYSYLRDFLPTTQTNNRYDNQEGVINIADSAHPIVDGLAGDFFPAQRSCCSLITDGSNWDPRSGATVVAKNGGDALIIADDSGLGRGVYFGVNIGSYNIFPDSVDDNTELLLENALAWSSQSSSTVPLPTSLALFLSGLAGFFWQQRKINSIR